jgi:CBS domain-containing protein
MRVSKVAVVRGGAMNILQMCDNEAPATVTPETSVADAITLMLDRRVGAVAVLDSEHRIAGIFTERDVLRKVALSGRDPHDIKIAEMMTRAVEMATPETSASDALLAMVESHYRHLPIVDKDGHLLGMLSIRNLLEARIDDLTHELDAVEQFANDAPGG